MVFCQVSREDAGFEHHPIDAGVLQVSILALKLYNIIYFTFPP